MFTITKDRNIYTWHDGTKQCYVDPISAYTKLTQKCSLGTELSALAIFYHENAKEEKCKDFDKMAETALSASSRLAEAGRYAFDVKVFDGYEGLLDHEVVLLVQDFLSYMHNLKKKAE